MSDYIFLFDLDATITRKEILPELAGKLRKEAEMKELTERTMQGEIPFERSFLERVNILKEVPVSVAREMIREIPVHEELAQFIRENKERCYVVTGNLDVWICDLMATMGMEDHCISSHATVENDQVVNVDEIMDKGTAIRQFAGRPFVAVGDGNNDADMLAAAEIGIGVGGVRSIAPSLLRCATHATYSEEKLCQFLRQLL